MSLFGSTLAGFAAQALLRTHGETVYYTPAGGARTAITAIVHRDAIEADNAQLRYPVELEVPMADVASVSVGGDLIELAKRVGDSALTSFRVHEILDQDGALWRLGVR